MLDDTVHGKDNLEEKTREDADNRMYYLRLNMFNKDAVVMEGDMRVFLYFQLNMSDHK